MAQSRAADEIRRVLAHAHAAGTPVVPRGVASSTYGGARPTKAESFWTRPGCARSCRSTTNKNGASPRPRVRWSDLERARQPPGLALRNHPANCFSMVAGRVPTVGYGIGSTRYGPLSASVEALRVVLADGFERRLLPADPEFGLWFGSVRFGRAIGGHRRGRAARPQCALDPDSEAPGLRFDRRTCRRAWQDVRTRSLAFGNLRTAARMREKNRLMKRQDFEEKATLVPMLESLEDAGIAGSCGGRPREAWKARLCWEDRFFPIRAKKLGPGILAAKMTFDDLARPAMLYAGGGSGGELLLRSGGKVPDRGAKPGCCRCHLPLRSTAWDRTIRLFCPNGNFAPGPS